MDEYWEDLCAVCIHAETCELPRVFPVTDCLEFEDDYDGPEYYDGDAVLEWRNEVYYKIAPVE